MRQKHCIKSSFYRPRDSSGAAWDRLQRERPVGEDVGLPVSWSDLITFSHRDIGPRAYMGHLVMVSGDQGFEGQNYVPKTEAQKWSRNSLKMEAQKRNRKNPPSRFMICTDDDMFKGDPKIQTPKAETTDYSTSSSHESPIAKPVKTEPSNDDSSYAKTPQKSVTIREESNALPPVGLMARDPDGSNPHEIVLDSDTDVEVHEHGPIAIHPNERVTMGRKHRKAVLDGISNLNKHDMMIQSGLGLISNPSHHDSKTVVFTSHPFVFVQDGVGASHLDPEFNPIGYQNIVIAIGYNNPNDPLGHGRFLAEVELMCDLDSCKFLHIDIAMTDRWEKHQHPQTPYINDHGLAFTCNDEQWSHDFESCFRGQTMDDVLSWKFADWIGSWAKEDELNHQMGIAFVGDMHEETLEDDQQLDALWDSGDRAQANPVEELISEETLIDEVEIPGLPQDEVERRRQWRKLPARVRIDVRRLHRQFGHVPKQTMIHLLRAARVRSEFTDAVKLHRCTACEQTSRKKPTHKTALPHNYTFNHSLGIDVFEIVDAGGSKFQVLNMVDLGTTFQLCEVVRNGQGQPSSSECLKALQKRWFSWSGHPVNLMCDRGLHNRGVLSKYMDDQIERAMAEIITPACQPLSHSPRVAGPATQPLCHSARVAGPATLGEWLS